MKQKLVDININSINPNPSQPRQIFSDEELASLSKSIAENGLIQPLIVRRVGFGYELIAGERRLRACKLAGFQSVPCVISGANSDQSAILALIENIQRANLNVFEEAEGIKKLIEKTGMTQEECAKSMGKSQSAIANKLRLLTLSDELKIKILKNNLTERHARALLKLQESKRGQALQLIIDNNLNVEKTEQMIEKMTAPKVKSNKKIRVIKDVRLFQNTIKHAVKLLKSTGVKAEVKCVEDNNNYEWKIIIPKTNKQAL